ncbi:MAG: cyclic nucleotide-binding protein [Leptolyngbya foveolarum]|uniref:Cyclic nucleotide-binding protein n=1 Tax=Leptolyngbya foveolarum TaxID=47253 RepID=A0A2W4TXF9_9CYAN|nr:MAG: cyclic nucleotide-binding protein [Leptolyngbya foveolarum]
MLPRFSGEEGKRRLIEVLSSQKLIAGDHQLAELIAGEGKLLEFRLGDALISAEDDSNNIYFIVHGSVDVLVKERLIAQRHQGTHIGEMALIDPSAKRCADVVAKGQVIACTLDEPTFFGIVQKQPDVWRRLAKELAARLRQRNSFVALPNSQPHLFIGSSVEVLPVARAIQLGLEHDPVSVKVWTDNVFRASSYTIEALEKEVKSADFGLLVLSPDDKVLKREFSTLAPRDNVIFELGLCIGAMTRSRSFFVSPRGVDISIPTDLLGLTALSYKLGQEKDYDIALAPVCEHLRRLISGKGTR